MSLANIIKQFLAVMDASGDLPETADHLAALALIAEQARTELERLQTLDPPLRPYQKTLLDQIESMAGATDRPTVAVTVTPRRQSLDEWWDALASGLSLHELIAAGHVKLAEPHDAFRVDVKTNADGMSRENEAQAAHEEQVGESIQEWVARVAGSPSVFMQTMGRATRIPATEKQIADTVLAYTTPQPAGNPTRHLTRESSAAHALACVRACRGISDAELNDIVSSGETLLMRLNEAMTAKEKAERERDRLLEVISRVEGILRDEPKRHNTWLARDVLKNAIKGTAKGPIKVTPNRPTFQQRFEALDGHLLGKALRKSLADLGCDMKAARLERNPAEFTNDERDLYRRIKNVVGGIDDLIFAFGEHTTLQFTFRAYKAQGGAA